MNLPDKRIVMEHRIVIAYMDSSSDARFFDESEQRERIFDLIVEPSFLA